jgi:uncharacterized membrane protein YdbT with pleckstrin-like domain
MSYIKKSLVADEKIIYFTRSHIIVFYPAIIWIFLALLIALTFSQSSFLVLAILFIASGYFVKECVDYYSSEYVVTNKRVLMKKGFFRTQSVEISLDRIESIYIERNIIGRALNFGTIIISGIGGTKNPLFYIPNPLEFRKQLETELEKLPEKTAPTFDWSHVVR